VCPESGEVEFVEVEGDPYTTNIYTTNICFGGEGMSDAWITASGTGCLYGARWKAPGLRLNYNG